MTQSEIIDSLTNLGHLFSNINADSELVNKAFIENKWFTPKSQLTAFKYWSDQLKTANLNDWLSYYSYTKTPINVGLIMAGNIPLVGIHDLICVLLSGNRALVKPSSDDSVLMLWVIDELIKISQELEDKIVVIEKLNNCEALIATGSDNTARYFNHYFKDVPRIIRKNRHSLAVLSGKETRDDLLGLADDIFMYYGLGCRNISKLLVPENYNFNDFFEALESYNYLLHHNKYYNNYTYHKAIFLMNLAKHLDNGFLLLKEDDRLSSPLGCLFYSTYKNHHEILEYIDQHKESLQIIVGHKDFISESIPFGQSQNPGLNDYADSVDTMRFLNQL